MQGTVLIKSCFYCSNIWSDREARQVRQCYLDLVAQAKQKGARLLIIAPNPYDRTEAEEKGWREVSQRGADLFESLEKEIGLFNTNRVLRDQSLPYLDEKYQRKPYDSHPNDAGCWKAVQEIDAWMPKASELQSGN